MLHKLFSAICIIFIFSHSLMAQEPKWLIKIRRIVPLQSTESDVKKLFGKATRRYANIGEYKTKDGILTIEYSTGECSSSLATYNVPKETVVDVSCLLDKFIDFKTIGEDLSNFAKEESSDTQNETYKNTTKGIRYDVYVRNEEDIDYEKSPRFLTSLSIFPPKKYSYLECSNNAKLKRFMKNRAQNSP